MYKYIGIFSMNRMERIVLNGKITHCARRVIIGWLLDTRSTKGAVTVVTLGIR